MHMEDLHEQWRLGQARAEFTRPSSGEIITLAQSLTPPLRLICVVFTFNLKYLRLVSFNNVRFYQCHLLASFLTDTFPSPWSIFGRRSVCLSVCPACNVGILWPNGWMDQDATWYEGRFRPRPHCVIHGDPAHPQKGHSPQFSADVYCGQTVAHISYCWALVTCNLKYLRLVNFNIRFCQCHLLSSFLDWHVSFSIYLHHRFRPMLSDRCLSCLSVCNVGVLWPNGCMDQDEIWHGDRPRPRRHCVRWGLSCLLLKRGTQEPPILGACLLWPNGWMNQDATWCGGRPWPWPHC